MMRWRGVTVGMVAAIVVAGSLEIFARAYLGLGDPPLTVRDAVIDYMLKPGSYRRFGMAYDVNSYGMRAPEPLPKGACDIRVLALGDSVLNGGAVVDQKLIATSLLGKELGQRFKKSAWVGNASAGGWAPENELAYVRKFGWFSADAVVIVVNTHDLRQVASFASDLGPNFPADAPVSAVYEAVIRYLPRYGVNLPGMFSAHAGADAPDRADVNGPALLAELVRLARQNAGHVVVIHNRSSDELNGRPTQQDIADAAEIARIVHESGATYLDVAEELPRWGGAKEILRDGIHLNADGNALFASLMVREIEQHLKTLLQVRGCRPGERL